MEQHGNLEQPIKVKHKITESSSANQNQVSLRRKTPEIYRLDWWAFSALGSDRLAISYRNTWRVLHPHLISSLFLLPKLLSLKEKAKFRVIL